MNLFTFIIFTSFQDTPPGANSSITVGQYSYGPNVDSFSVGTLIFFKFFTNLINVYKITKHIIII